MNVLLELREVRAAYDGVTVLHGVDLSVAAGQVVALLGPNGAGKTTTLRVAAGVHPVQSGRLVLGGRDVTGIAPRDLARAGVCLIPEGRGVFPNLSVRDNLLMMTFTGHNREHIEELAFSRFPVLARYASRAAGTLSGGEQQMLALARGLATDPAVLLLDELSMGLAPLVVTRLYEQVAEIARQGVAVLIVEQFAAAVLVHRRSRGRARARPGGTAGPPRQRVACRIVRPLPGELHLTSTETRADRFVRELAELKIADPAAGRPRLWLRLGATLMVLGPVLGVSAFLISHRTSSPLVQGDAITIGLGAVTVSVVGAALFLRYSLTGFLRFWMARQSYDLTHLADRVFEKEVSRDLTSHES